MWQMASKFSHLLICFFILFSIQSLISHSRTLKPVGQSFNFLQNMEEVHKGQTIIGISEVKKYLNRFGYYPNLSDNNLNDYFDDPLEFALKTYQNFYQLEITGKLDSATKKKMMTPRCGMPDITNFTSSQPFNKSNYRVLYSWPAHKPTWSQYDLTFKFNDNVPNDERGFWTALSLAFESWQNFSQFTFNQVSDGEPANIVIGFYSGDHGDGDPLDGPGGTLAHSFYPEDGRSHFDSAEAWSTNPSMNQMDLQTVAVHEFGHILGLGHSDDPKAVMYPTIAYGSVNRVLTKDDIDGIKALYPN